MVMLDQFFRNAKSRWLEPYIARVLGRSRLSPLFVTFLSFLSGALALVAVYFGRLGPAVLLWVLCRVFDGLDGMLARAQGRQSDIGGYVDLVGDFLLYAALPVVIAVRLGGSEHYLAAAVLLAVFYVNAAVWMAASAIYEKHKARAGQTSITMPRSLVEGLETWLLNSLMLALPQHFVLLCIIMAVLTFLGACLCFAQSLINFRKLRTPQNNATD